MSQLVHRPAARGATIFSMVLLATVSLPAFIFGRVDAAMIPGLVVFGLFEGFLATLLFQRVEVRVEGPSLSFVHRRWPLSSRAQTVPLRDLQTVELEGTHGGRRGRGFRLVLRLKDGATVPLTAAYFGRSAQQDRDLAALQQLISSASG